MKIRDYRNNFINVLTPIYEVMEAENFFSMLLEEFRGMKRSDLALNPEAEFSQAEVAKWNGILEKLKNEIPIQYIIGKAYFFGLEFLVNPNVLIPRPETEELVQWILSEQQLERRQNPRILDIGTGSGCIAIALAKNLPSAEVSAIDVSGDALATAVTNATHNGVSVDFIERNILQTKNLEQQFDIIVSNPPYVRILEKAEIRKNVLQSEPHLALFVEDDDALLFYRKIADLAQINLLSNGLLFFEVNQYLGNETVELLVNKGFKNVELKQDIYGNDRMLKAIKP
jgi:release factor glutamine methyltransferase